MQKCLPFKSGEECSVVFRIFIDAKRLLKNYFTYDPRFAHKSRITITETIYSLYVFW